MSDSIQYKLTWDDYGILIEDLWKDLESKLKAKKVKIDAIVIILREGGFTGLPLAYKLNTYKVLTIQFKYMLYDGSNELKYIASLPEVNYELPNEPVFLLCDTFPSGGKTKNLVIEKILEKYTKAKFVFASLIQDKSSESIPEVLFSSFAVPVDDDYKTSHPLYKKNNVDNVLYTLLPWENKEEELAGPNQTKWDYN